MRSTMRPTMRRVVAAAAASVVLSGLALAAPASAGVGYVDDEEECSGPAVAAAPAHDGNAAPVAISDAATVIIGGYAAIDVVANDTDADGDGLTLVSTGSSRYGYTCIDDNQVVYYSTGDKPRSGKDKITYAVTDGDSYRTSTVSISYTRIAADAPQVTKKLKVTKGKVTRKASLLLSNPDPTYTVHVFLLEYSNDDSETLTEIDLAPGATETVKTKKRGVEFFTVISEPSAGAVVQSGYINTVRGRVWTDEGGDYYLGRSSRVAGRAHELLRRAQR